MDDIIFDWLLTEAIEDSSSMSQANKASVSDPDTLSFEEAMSNVENIQNWMKAAEAEIKLLEKNGTWKEVPITDAKTQILPGTWVFCRKHTPDSTMPTISKYKACYCVQGDLRKPSKATYGNRARNVCASRCLEYSANCSLYFHSLWHGKLALSTSAVHSYRRHLPTQYGFTCPEASVPNVGHPPAYNY